MPNGDAEQFQCYNRGCGQKYAPESNNADSCRHHPGDPVFHDAYKGWSCCSKKCIDFTEFLNIPGCTLSQHSNVKPPEPEKPPQLEDDFEVITVVKPEVTRRKERPPLDTPMVRLVPEIAPSLKQQILAAPTEAVKNKDPNVIAVGTLCKNGGCKVSYEGPATDNQACVHHPGVPIFHEGLKFWSCCTKRTTDFNAFLDQVGCTRGKHLWVKQDQGSQTVQCRWDHHQTASHVVVSVYAKQYSTELSTVDLNPVRLKIRLVFPEQSGAAFQLDTELQGIVDVAASQTSFYGTKVEVKLRKAEVGSWSKLGTPKVSEDSNKAKAADMTAITPKMDAVELDDL